MKYLFGIAASIILAIVGISAMADHMDQWADVIGAHLMGGLGAIYIFGCIVLFAVSVAGVRYGL